MNKKQMNEIFNEMLLRYYKNENKILIMNIVKHTLEKVAKKDGLEIGFLELTENIFSSNYPEIPYR